MTKYNSELQDTASNISFVWSSAKAAASYKIDSSIDESFDSPFISVNNILNTNYIYSNSFIPNGFYWRVGVYVKIASVGLNLLQ